MKTRFGRLLRLASVPSIAAWIVAASGYAQSDWVTLEKVAAIDLSADLPEIQPGGSSQMVGDHLLIAKRDGSDRGVVLVVGGATPAQMGVVGRLSLPVSPLCLRVIDRDYALIGWVGEEAACGIAAIDIRNVRSPIWVGGIETPGSVAVSVNGNHAYVLGVADLTVINISNRTKILKLSTVLLEGECWSLAVAGDYAYVFSRRGEWSEEVVPSIFVSVLDLSNPSAPKFVVDYKMPTGTWPPLCSYLRGSLLYVGSGRAETEYDGWLTVLDASKPSALTFVSRMETSCRVTDMDFSGRYAFVAPHHGVAVFDTAKPLSLRHVGDIGLDGGTSMIHVRNGLVHVVYGQKLGVLRITEHPAITDHAVLGDRQTLQWNDPANGMKLQRATSLTAPDWQGLRASENTNAVTLPVWGGNEFFRLVTP